MNSLGWLILAWVVGWGALTNAVADPAVIPLWPEGVPGLKRDGLPEQEDNGRFSHVHQPTLTMYRPEVPNGTAVIYAAGGGYVRVAVGPNGGEITRWLNRIGITVFVLKYRHSDYGQPAPLQDALRAVRIIRSRAGEFGLKPDRIGMLGGSAGGHLTASAGSLFDAPEGRNSKDYEEMKKQGIKFYKTPDAILRAQLDAWDKVSEKKAAENPFFKRVMDSQRVYAQRAGQWQSDYMVNFKMAYDFYFAKKKA